MTHAPIPQVATEYAIAERRWRFGVAPQTWTGIGLLLPAVFVTFLFAVVPLVYLFVVSLTREESFFFTAVYTAGNYRAIWDRFLPTVWTTVELAALSSLANLVFGYPFAYILIRKVRYRELVRTLM